MFFLLYRQTEDGVQNAELKPTTSSEKEILDLNRREFATISTISSTIQLRKFYSPIS